MIGTSGTILSLGTVATAMDRGVVPAEIRNLRVAPRASSGCARSVTELGSRASGCSCPAWIRGAPTSRWPARCCSTRCCASSTPSEITLCDLALREGLVLDYIQQHRTEIARVDRYPDVRRRSTIELAERCNWEADHSRQVARLALTLFDQTRDMHGLGDREREWLEFASLLHDIGNHISYERHHRHSYYLIKNGDLRGFEPEEIEVIALVARYHRRATPDRRHEGYRDLLERAAPERCACCRRSCAWPRRSIAAATASCERSTSARAAKAVLLQVAARRRQRARGLGREQGSCPRSTRP